MFDLLTGVQRQGGSTVGISVFVRRDQFSCLTRTISSVLVLK